MKCCKNCVNGICRKSCCGKTYECGLSHVMTETHYEPFGYGHAGIAVNKSGHVKKVAGNQPACEQYKRR